MPSTDGKRSGIISHQKRYQQLLMSPRAVLIAVIRNYFLFYPILLGTQFYTKISLSLPIKIFLLSTSVCFHSCWLVMVTFVHLHMGLYVYQWWAQGGNLTSPLLSVYLFFYTQSFALFFFFFLMWRYNENSCYYLKHVQEKIFFWLSKPAKHTFWWCIVPQWLFLIKRPMAYSERL